MTIRKNKPDNLCAENFEYINFLLRINKKYPYLELKPTSALARVVMEEYNSIPPKNIRKLWPEDICGYLANISNNVSRSLRPSIINLFPQTDLEYGLDSCIVAQSSRPGSPVYADCEDGLLFEDIYSIDWIEYFKNPLFPEEEENFGGSSDSSGSSGFSGFSGAPMGVALTAGPNGLMKKNDTVVRIDEVNFQIGQAVKKGDVWFRATIFEDKRGQSAQSIERFVAPRDYIVSDVLIRKDQEIKVPKGGSFTFARAET